VARLGDYIQEECNQLGSSGAQDLRLIGVSNEHGLHSSTRDTSDDLSRYQRIERYWFAYNPMRVNVGSIGLADDDTKTGFTSPDYTVFSCKEGLDPHYLLYFLKSNYGLEAIARNCSGAVRKRLYYSGLSKIELPIPGIDQQRDVVARIHSIKETIRFIHEQNSDRHELPSLRQALLQEAIQGKLTADWRAVHLDVEPASQLLRRIQSEKSRLITAKKLRPEKSQPEITGDEAAFEIPETWEWSRISSLGIVSPRNNAPDDTSVSFVPMAAIPAEFAGRIQPEKRLWREIKNGYTHIANGDVALAKITPCFENGKAASFKNLENAVGAATTELHVLRPILVDPDYLLIFLKSPSFVRNGIPRMTGTAGQKRVPTEYFSNAPIPLPPLVEQAAIVSRVEALMTTCRALNEEIEQSRTHAAHLLQAVLKEAFLPTV
jgi:restriction endonuclease S subunit